MSDSDAIIDIRLTDEPIVYEPFVPSPQPGGGECVFVGRTRQESDAAHGALAALSYEAYGTMAEAILRSLAEAAIGRFGCTAVRIVHRLGSVPPGDASVLIQVVTPHRAESFAACRLLIDRLKAEAPIWKREAWADGATSWSTGTLMGARSSPEVTPSCG